jgi:hypothetical protein
VTVRLLPSNFWGFLWIDGITGPSMQSDLSLRLKVWKHLVVMMRYLTRDSSRNSRTFFTRSMGLNGLMIMVFDGSRTPYGARSLSG